MGALRWSDAAAHAKLDERQYVGYWQCMTTRGFALPFEPPTTTHAVEGFDRRWGVRDDAEATSSAFGLPAGTFVDPSTSAEFVYRETLSADQRARFDLAAVGPPGGAIESTVSVTEMGVERHITFTLTEDSCSAQGIVAAYGSIDKYLRFEGYRQAISYALFTLDAEASVAADVTNALHEWANCMQRHDGESVTDPMQLAEKFGSSVAPEATNAARAHVRCLTESRLYERWEQQLVSTALSQQPGLLPAAVELDMLRMDILKAIQG